MIVRTYGRRNRAGIPRGAGGYSDSLNDGVPDDLPFSPSSQDFFSDFPFSSQDSSSLFPSSSSFDPDPFGFDDLSQSDAAAGGQRKAKKPRNGRFERTIPSTYSTTLMEAQEFGEMMEHVDEVNFALDGLRKGQPVRIRRASLLSLLSICGTSQQRRLLRTQGMAKTILDAMLGLSFDDSSSNLAAAALFYVLSIDGLDDHLLESPSCILFLIRLLKPVVSTATEGKARSIGSKLLSLHKDSDLLRDTSKVVDPSAAAIVAKVHEILIACKDLKSHGIHDGGKQRPELSPKWIALLTLEKSCLSKISFEDTSGPIRKAGSNFKEKLRELGGLDAVFEVAMNCHFVMERWRECGSPPVQDGKNDSGLQSLMLLLKCLKIMENAAFLSEDNQSHLLGMKGKLDSHGTRLSFPKLLISIVEILSGFCLLKCSSVTSVDGKSCGVSDEIDKAIDSNDVLCISSTNSHSTSSGKSISVSQSSTARLSLSASTSGTASAFMNTAYQLRMGIDSSTSSSCNQGLMSSNSRTHVSSNGLQTKCGFAERSRCTTDVIELLEDDQDPYAFDEDDFQPSKWDLLSGKKRRSRTRNIAITSKEVEDRCQHQLMTQQESSNSESYLQKASDAEQYHLLESSEQNAVDEEFSSLIADCHLTAIKVLMNLTNDNPVGCQQIAASGGLETMSSLIARHFPSFSSSPSLLIGSKEDKSSIELGPQKDYHLTDQELDFLVAILGLLVNLVEKDGRNRSRLAAASVSLPSSEGLEEESHKDVIPLLCSVFLAHQGAGDTGGAIVSWDDEAAMLQGEKEAEKTIVEAYSALLLAFLSTESKSIRDSIANCLPNQSLAILVPVLERFVAFHLTLNMISPETHQAVNEVIESCRIP